jgi:hypothetical protein
VIRLHQIKDTNSDVFLLRLAMVLQTNNNLVERNTNMRCLHDRVVMKVSATVKLSFRMIGEQNQRFQSTSNPKYFRSTSENTSEVKILHKYFQKKYVSEVLQHLTRISPHKIHDEVLPIRSLQIISASFFNLCSLI